MSSKALVIKGVSFGTNRLTTVTFDEGKHCTGISLSESAIEFTTLTPVSLVATVTPSDTTDALSWETSDDSVVTVANGIVSVVGLGTAVITAVCGSQTATCSVTVSTITIDLNDSTIYGQSNTGYVSKNEGRDYFSYSDTTAGRTYHKVVNDFTYKMITKDGETYENIFGIPFLKNVSTMTITYPKAFDTDPRLGLADADSKETYVPAMVGAKAYAMLSVASTRSGDIRTAVFDVSEADPAVNAFVICIRGGASVVASEVTGNVTLVFA